MAIGMVALKDLPFCEGPSHRNPEQVITSSPTPSSWSVYLVISTNNPIKTYVGVTTDFSRRLKQHNGDLKGGAKASRTGRPWICACIIQGFKDHSEACELEAKWKISSCKLSRKRRIDDMNEAENEGSLNCCNIGKQLWIKSEVHLISAT